jgi:hypothetical protein
MLKQVVIVGNSTPEQTQLKIIVIYFLHNMINVLPSSILSVLSGHINLLYSDCLLVFFVFWLFLKKRLVLDSFSCQTLGLCLL